MAIDAIAEARQSLERAVRDLDATWLERRFDDLVQFLHPAVVFVPPGDAPARRGRDACVASYRAFMDRAVVHKFKSTSAEVEYWGGTGVATYSWEISYAMEGAEHHDAGREFLVLARDQNRWRVVWREMRAGAPAKA